MRRINHIGAFALMCLLASSSLAQQKVQFTQYMFNGLVINPAYAGADEKLSLTFVNRNQWSGIDGAPTTQTFTAHTLFKSKQFGLGTTLVNDQIGIHRNFNAGVSYAYHLHIRDLSWLSMGLQTGMKNFRSDYASLTVGGNSDPASYNAITQRTFFDLAAGLYYRSPRLNVGLSAPELLPQQFQFNDTLSVRLNTINLFLYAKYRFTLSQNFDVEPSVLFKYLKGVPTSFDINTNMVYRKALTLGLSYRKDESVDFLFKAQLTAQLQMGYAYDYPLKTTTLLTTSGSHELMVQYVFSFEKKHVTSPR